jgi:hypothetical protein
MGKSTKIGRISLLADYFPLLPLSFLSYSILCFILLSFFLYNFELLAIYTFILSSMLFFIIISTSLFYAVFFSAFASLFHSPHKNPSFIHTICCVVPLLFVILCRTHLYPFHQSTQSTLIRSSTQTSDSSFLPHFSSIFLPSSCSSPLYVCQLQIFTGFMKYTYKNYNTLGIRPFPKNGLTKMTINPLENNLNFSQEPN